jgi:hypothetical protein
MSGAGEQPFEPLQDHLLYDTAMLEIIEALPVGVPEGARIEMRHVREAMIMAWIRGQTWAREKCGCERCQRAFVEG